MVARPVFVSHTQNEHKIHAQEVKHLNGNGGGAGGGGSGCGGGAVHFVF